MADRAVQIRSWPGVIAAAFVAVLILGTLIAVVLRAEARAGLGPSDWAAIRFTIKQSVMSAVLSVALAVPVARALARRQFFGRKMLVMLLGAPFILPVIVAVLGLLAVLGRNGVLNGALGWLGLPEVQIYGLHGVVLAHVFFNMPLAVRVILQGWQAIPAERFRLAAQLRFSPRDMWRVLERPMLMRVVPGAFAIIFALCMSSFAVALTLGGGPKATTVELAIYQAFRFDFDLGKAALLGCIQIGLAGGAAMVALRLSSTDSFGGGLDRTVERWDAQGRGQTIWDGVLIASAALFLLLPLGMIVGRGVQGVFEMPVNAWWAAAVSLQVSLVSTVVLLLLALPIAIGAARLRLLESVGVLGIASSPLVIGTGLFVMIYPVADPIALALPVTALVNAVMALPFALRVLVPAVRDVVQDYGRLAASLNVTGAVWLRIVLLPRLRAPLGFAAGLTAALSMGDLGVIALFADAERATLPLQMYRLMGSYQTEAAAGAGLVLLTLSFGIFWLFDQGGRSHVDA